MHKKITNENWTGDFGRWRFIEDGTPKQILPVFGDTLIKHLVNDIFETQVYPVTIVLGANKNKIVPELKDMPISIIDNPNWQLGIGTSIKMGLVGSYLASNVIDALMYMPADMPNISSKTINKFIDEATKNADKNIVYCETNQEFNLPILIKRVLFEKILDLKPEEDFKLIIENNKIDSISLNLENMKTDLNTRQEYFDFINSLN